MEKVRFGLIGIGAQGGAYAGFLTGQGGFPGMPAPQCPPHCALGALCDIDPEKEKMCREKYPDVPFFKDWKEMVASGTVDAVITTVPHYLHHEIAIYCLEHGMNVLVEKPAGVRAKDVMAMNKCAEEHPDVAFGIMFNQRTNKLYQKIKEIVASGELGEIRRSNWIITNWYRSQSYYNSGGWRATWKGEGGGVLLNQDPHQLDLWQWLVGMPVRLRAFCQFGKHRDIEVEDEVTAYAEYANGATGVFITTVAETQGTNRLEIVGDHGKVVVEEGKLRYWRLRESETAFNARWQNGFGEPECWEVSIPVAPECSEHHVITANFSAAILRGEPLIAPGLEGIRGLTLSNAMHLSTWTDDWVDLPLNEKQYLRLLQQRISTSVAKETASITLDASGTW